MAQYRRKPITIEANQYFKDGPAIAGVYYPPSEQVHAEFDEDTGEVVFVPGAYVVTIYSQIEWLEDGDWVIAEPDDELQFHVLKPEIFAEQYELVEDDAFSHFVTHSGLGDVPVAEPTFDARSGKMWVVGKSLGGSNHWEFQGIFDNEPAALRACPFGKPYFVAPAMLNEVLPQATLSWKGLYWPALNTGDASNVIRKMASYDRA